MSIARKVTLYVLLFSGVLTLLATAQQLYMDYQDDLTVIDSTLDLVDKSHIDSLTLAIWNLDETLVGTELSEIMNLPDIAYLELKEPQFESITRGELPAKNQRIARTYNLSDSNTMANARGTLTITMTTEFVQQRLLDKIVVIAIAQSAKSLTAAFFIVFVFYMLVTRHLEHIRDFITDPKNTASTRALRLEKGRGIFTRKSETDELGILVTAINDMRGSLNEQITEKSVSNQLLQQEIAVRKKAEQELVYLRNYLSNVINSMPSILIGVDYDGIVTQWNTEAERATGITAELAVAQPLVEVFPRLNIELIQIRDAIKSGKQQETLDRLHLIDGKSRYEDLTIYPLMSDGIEGAVIRLDDVTQKNLYEIELRRAQKMEAMGQLTGGVAHDFNNILSIVIGNLQLLQKQLVSNDDASRRIKQALKGAQRGVDITRKLLSFSHETSHEAILIDITKVIGDMGDLIAKSLTASIEFQLHLSGFLWPVNADPGDLEDVILNLSLNAKDAMQAGGTLTIETKNCMLNATDANLIPGASMGEFVEITVEDSGAGMTDEVKGKALEPFFTTKPQGKGTGLGLSMVYGFVQRSGGFIKIDSEVGTGTKFYLYLPRAEDKPSHTEAESSQEDLPGGTETVLVVDDEKALTEIASIFIRALGYSVLIAENADQALELLQQHNNVDLVFSDIIMPGKMNGYQLAEIIKRRYPNIKILMTSGFTDTRESNADNPFIDKLIKDRLQKPYNQPQLSVAIRCALDDCEI